MNNTEITIGVVAAGYDNLVNAGKPIKPDGTGGETTSGRVISYVLEEGHCLVDIILTSSDWRVYMDRSIILCAFIIENQEVSYICQSGIASTASPITYSGIIS